ncbi:MAG: ketoacyl-ACP synthase III [Deltaproteobacteria bacterium]|jgi:3-oxoacyl-[acyl-carrier-protein] synthase-3|nr:ketoacyl-ACP synthase III [Deltaproteobacteria bacterium]
MIASTLEGIKITGLASAVPTKKVSNVDYCTLFGQETVDKIIATTSVEECYHVHENQTASDLAFAAARHLLEQLDIPLKSIGLLIFVVTYPDYFVPATANVLHKRLGLSTDCLAFDMNLACSGFVVGLQTTGALLKASSARYALLLVGDSTSKVVSPDDKSRLLFGDGGAAVLLEAANAATPMHFGVRTDGRRFKSIIVPAGAFRQPQASKEPELWGDGNTRTDYHLFMDGTNVFSFTMTDVPALIKEFLEYHQLNIENFDSVVFHQPNAFILKHLAKKIKLPLEKMPLSLDRYGNTSGASIPITLSDAFGLVPEGRKHLLLSGFGVGLSWALASVSLEAGSILPIIHTDEYHQDGLVSHE